MPSPVLLQALSDIRGSQLYPASICPATGGFVIAVHDYMTDGSGSGTVQLDLDVEDSQLVDVERNGTAWRVVRRRRRCSITRPALGGPWWCTWTISLPALPEQQAVPAVQVAAYAPAPWPIPQTSPILVNSSRLNWPS